MSQTPLLNVTDSRGRRQVLLKTLPFILGRGTRAALYVPSSDVSRAHAEITDEDGRYVVRDGGSRFGTFVNGAAVIGSRLLQHGDRIRLGRHQETDIVFVLEDAAAVDAGDRRAAPSSRRDSRTSGKWPPCSTDCARSDRAGCSTKS